MSVNLNCSMAWVLADEERKYLLEESDLIPILGIIVDVDEDLTILFEIWKELLIPLF